VVVVSAVQAQALQELPEEQEESEEADLWAKEVDDLGAAGTEPEEGEAHAVVTMRAVPEVAELDVDLAMTRQGFFLMSVLGETTSRKQRTRMLARVQGTLRWSQWRPTSGRTFVYASFPSSSCCSSCLSCCTSCRS